MRNRLRCDSKKVFWSFKKEENSSIFDLKQNYLSLIKYFSEIVIMGEKQRW